MLIGFNNNIVYKSNVYHVQTEDGGPKNCAIITLIYLKGVIVASKKTSYADLMNEENSEETIKLLMEDQHRNMIKALLRGKFKK